jgi:hypothetical protein
LPDFIALIDSYDKGRYDKRTAKRASKDDFRQTQLIQPDLLGRWSIAERSDFCIEMEDTLFPSLEDFGEFRVRSESILTSPLGDGWAIKLSLIDDYDSAPENNDVKKNDLCFISAVEYTF